MLKEDRQTAFTESLIEHIRLYHSWEDLSKTEAVEIAVKELLNDRRVIIDFLDAIDVCISCECFDKLQSDNNQLCFIFDQEETLVT